MIDVRTPGKLLEKLGPQPARVPIPVDALRGHGAPQLRSEAGARVQQLEEAALWEPCFFLSVLRRGSSNCADRRCVKAATRSGSGQARLLLLLLLLHRAASILSSPPRRVRYVALSRTELLSAVRDRRTRVALSCWLCTRQSPSAVLRSRRRRPVATHHGREGTNAHRAHAGAALPDRGKKGAGVVVGYYSAK